MADTILPWICPYLIGVAQQYGAFPKDAPLVDKGKKVQVVKFLTYGEESQESVIWARISDKNHVIPVCFSKEAIQEHYKLYQTPFTKLRTAIISIKGFRPVFRRVPLGGKGGMSAERALTLDCFKFQYIGSAGEDEFGSPVPVERNADILEWSNGLKQDGGAGNVLRDRKREEEMATSKEPRKDSYVNPAFQKVKKIVAAKPSARPPAPAIVNADPLRAYEKSWVATRKPEFRRPPADIAVLLEGMPVRGDPEPANDLPKAVETTPARPKISKHALDLETSPASSIHSQTREASSPGTVFSGWSPSPLRQLAPGTQSTDLPSSQPLPPTPAQRNNGDDERLPPSSPPPTSQLVVNETRLLTSSLRPTVSPPTHARRAVTRKIPRPPQPIPRRSPTGFARILAPNSDTSLSHSQSQSQSQSQSRSQPLRHESSQREYLSQLSQDPVTRDIVMDELVPKEPSIKDLQKEGMSQPHLEGADDKTDDEADDNQSNHEGTHDSLFSGSFSDSEDSSYDGDHSSLEPLQFREGMFLQVSAAAPGGEQHPSQSQDDHTIANHISTSLVVHPASSQRRDESLDITRLEDVDEVMNFQSPHAVNGRDTHSGHTSPIVDKEIGAETQMLDRDEDDAQTHDSLFGTSFSTQSQDSQIVAPSSSVLKRTETEEIPETQTQVKPLRKSPSPTISEIVSKTPRPSDHTVKISDRKPAIVKPHTSSSSDLRKRKDVIPHDAKAWRGPSFLKPSSSINIDSPSTTATRSATETSNTLGKRKTPNRTSENTASNNATPKRHVLIRGDQNSDPSTRAASSLLLNHKQKKSSKTHSNSTKPETSPTDSSQSQPQKRARDSGSLPQTSDHVHKKRKTAHSNQVENPSLTVGETPRISSDQKQKIKLLGGWSPELDKPIILGALGSPSAEDVVTWNRLKDICLRTGRAREKESL